MKGIACAIVLLDVILVRDCTARAGTCSEVIGMDPAPKKVGHPKQLYQSFSLDTVVSLGPPFWIYLFFRFDFLYLISVSTAVLARSSSPLSSFPFWVITTDNSRLIRIFV